MSLTKLMIAIRQLENTTSTTGKKDLLLKYAGELPDFVPMLKAALNPYRRYNIQQIPEVTLGDKTIQDSWDMVEKCLVELETVKGPQAKDKYGFTAMWLNQSGRELFRRVVLKDLKCGVGATLVNNVFPKLIPVFGVSLAEPMVERHLAKIQKYPSVYHQPKLNGDRLVTIIRPGGEFEQFSRKGFVLHNYAGTARSLVSVLEQVGKKKTGMVFDGEIVFNNFFQTRSVRKTLGNEAVGAVYYIFDMIEYDEWQSNQTQHFADRAYKLKQLSNTPMFGHFDNLKYVETLKFGTAQITWPWLEKMRDKQIDAKYEGSMWRFNTPYNFGGRSSILKFKRMETMDCLVEQILEGEEDGKHQGRAGAILVRLPNGEQCKAGLSMTDAERQDLWDNQGKYVGLVAEIQYQEETQNKAGISKLQFPVMLQFREDKS